MMKTHSAAGGTIISHIETKTGEIAYLKVAKEMAEYHHERMDEWRLAFRIIAYNSSDSPKTAPLGLLVFSAVSHSRRRSLENLQNLVPDLGQTSEDLQNLVPNLGQTSEDLQNLVPDLGQTSEDFQNLVPDLGQTSEDLQNLVPDLRQTSVNFQKRFDKIQHRKSIARRITSRMSPL